MTETGASMPEEAAPDAVWRLFVALGIGDGLREALASAQRQLRRIGAKVAWVAPENLHVTLVFLGDGFAARVPELAAALDEAAGPVRPFELQVSGLGWFGSARSPRVLWAGVSAPPPELMELQRRCVTAAACWGVRPEDRPYRAHLTLGRVRSARGAEALTGVVGRLMNTVEGAVNVSRVLLMRSELGARGARHTLLHESRLKGA